MSIKLGIADDHELVLEVLEESLSTYAQVDSIHLYRDANSTIEGIEKNDLDVLILDLCMNSVGNAPTLLVDGLNVLEYCKKVNSKVKIIVLSNYFDNSFIQLAFKLGAKSYLLKNTSKQELINCIDAVSSGGTYIIPFVQKALDKPTEKDFSASGTFPLTKRERQVLLLTSKGQTSKEIAEMLGLKKDTISEYRALIMKKLVVKNVAEMVAVAIKNNLI